MIALDMRWIIMLPGQTERGDSGTYVRACHQRSSTSHPARQVRLMPGISALPSVASSCQMHAIACILLCNISGQLDSTVSYDLNRCYC